jgi:hypothetical protein
VRLAAKARGKIRLESLGYDPTGNPYFLTFDAAALTSFGFPENPPFSFCMFAAHERTTSADAVFYIGALADNTGVKVTFKIYVGPQPWPPVAATTLTTLATAPIDWQTLPLVVNPGDLVWVSMQCLSPALPTQQQLQGTVVQLHLKP